MDREQAKKLWPIIKAFAEGKQIQYFRKDSTPQWIDVSSDVSVDFSGHFSRYRIKPEPKYRPFADQEECWKEMLKHKPFGWLKSKTGKNYSFILDIDEDTCHFLADEYWSFDSLLETETFADGEAFGVKEEEY